MNWEQIQGNWKQVTGKAKEQWGKLTDDDMDVIAGKRDQLAGKIQQHYGIAKEEAEKQVDSWQDRASDEWFVKSDASTSTSDSDYVDHKPVVKSSMY